MSDLEKLFAQIPIADIAKKVGASEGDTTAAIATALPALLSGLNANAQDPAGESSLATALAEKDPSWIDGGIDLKDVDVKDGKKIVSNIFGDNSKQVASQLGGVNPGGESLMSKILPILAPIVLAFVAQKLQGSDSPLGSILGTVLQGASGSSSGSSGGGLGDILGAVLGGGGSTAASAPSSGGGLGDILGAVLGGGGSGSSGGGIEDLLGGLLGGGKR